MELLLGKTTEHRLKLTTQNLNATIVAMDFVIIFALGYCFRDFISYLKSIVNNSTLDKEFRTIVDLDNEWSNDDLP